MKDSGRTPGGPGQTDATPAKPKGGSAASAETPGALRHPFRSFIAVVVLAVLGLLSTAAFKSYRDLESAKSYEHELLEKIAGAKERIQALDHRIERIRHDPVMLERLAREDLGLVHADDTVIVLPEPEPVRPSPRPAGSGPVESAVTESAVTEPALTASRPQSPVTSSAP